MRGEVLCNDILRGETWYNDTLRGEVFHAAWFWVVRFFVRHYFCAVRFLLNDVLRSEAFCVAWLRSEAFCVAWLRSEAFCVAWLRGEVFHVVWFGRAEIDV